MTKTCDYPKKLINFLQEQAAEGNEMITTYSGDATVWLITYGELESYVTIVQWYEGAETFEIVNIEGQAFKRLMKVMQEVK